MGCEGLFNYTKFTRLTKLTASFCIEQDNDYDLYGNFDTPGTTKMIVLNIDRCKPTATQRCKSDANIDDFINYLSVITGYQEMSLLMNDYEMRPPLDQHLAFIEQ